MRDHLDELITSFPRLMKGRGPRIPGYVHPGWHPILMDLFRRIDELLDDGEADTFRVVQTKEKYGSLRVYVELAGHCDLVGDIHMPQGLLTIRVPTSSRDTPRPSKLDVIQGYIEEAASLSAVTCDLCGAGGQLRKDGWMRTRCEAHAASGLARFEPEEE